MPETIDLAAVRAQVPALSRTVHGRPVAYLDHAATAPTPTCVIDALGRAYGPLNANVHRGVHTMSADATQAFAAARRRVARFISASADEVVFTSGTTAALNLVAHGLSATRLRPRSRVLVSRQEHHANLVPWQLVAAPRGARVEALPCDTRGGVDLEAAERALRAGDVAVVCITLASNVLGTLQPVHELTRLAHGVGALVVADAAQAAAHGPIDVRALGVDALAFSGHKLFGPTGVGVAWARRELLQSWPPWQGGGDMVTRVTFDGPGFRAPPQRFEAGTPPIAQAIGLHAALDWLEDIGWARIQARETLVRDRIWDRLGEVDGLQLLPGPADLPMASFTFGRHHPHDVGTLLDQQGVAVRTGRHCADPIHALLGLDATVRASGSFLTTDAEIDRLVDGLRHVREVLGAP